MTPSSPHDPIISLTALGWELQPSEPETPGARPARVMLQSRGAWHVHDGSRDAVATLSGAARREEIAPATGDWVLVTGEGDGTWVIVSVLPRRTVVERKVAGRRSDAQVIATNVDVVAICHPCSDINERRLEREVTAAWQSGATPVVILTKADEAEEDPVSLMATVAAHAPGIEVLVRSAWDATGLADLSSRMEPGRTWMFFGPSGVGKSTLVNALAGEEIMATHEVREDGRGRHTTTARHLLVLPNGALVIDTPGMREFGLVGEDEDALRSTFADVDEVLVRGCRFADCAHGEEPGCALREALESGRLDPERVDAWQKLRREVAFMARRDDVRLQAEERRKWAGISKARRALEKQARTKGKR